MEEANLPEEIIVLIFSYLPVKSLIRFKCVSKRFRSIILSDSEFAKSQLQAARRHKTLTPRLLYSVNGPRFTSLDLTTPSIGDHSSVRNLKFPFRPPARHASLLGSCNGIVFLAFDQYIFYVWNPSTGYFKKLPDPGFSPHETELVVYGVGYLPATDDYRVFAVSRDYINDNDEAAIFSSRAQYSWKTLEVDVSSIISNQGTLLKEALHWFNDQDEIVAFDLEKQEDHRFRTMLLPHFNDGGNLNFSHLGVFAGECLSLARSPKAAADCIDLWIMREYGLRGSWRKLYNLKFSDPPKELWEYSRVLVMETSIVTEIFTGSDQSWLVKILHKEDKCSIHKVMVEGYWFNMIQYQESLLRLDD